MRHWLTGECGSSSSATTSLICSSVRMPLCPKRGMLVQAVYASRCRACRRCTCWISRPVAAQLAEVVQAGADRAVRNLLPRQLVAGVAVAARAASSARREYSMPRPVLRDLLAALPVAEELAVGRLLDRSRGSPSRCAPRIGLGQRPCRRTRCTASAFVLVEAVELGLAVLLERAFITATALALGLGVAGCRSRSPPATATARPAAAMKRASVSCVSWRRSVALDRRARRTRRRWRCAPGTSSARSTRPSVNSGSGKRCWRKQSFSRHWKVRNSPCDTR